MTSIRCQYVPITAKVRLRPIVKCNFRQILLRLFANSSNQWSAKTMMGRSEYSENLFYTGLQQHSSNDAQVYCFVVALSYWFTTAKLQIIVSAMECGFRGVEFGWCKSVAQCVYLSMYQYRKIGVAMQFCKLAYSAICGVEQSILHRIFMEIWMKTATSTIFIEIVLVIRENCANFASVLVLWVTEEGFLLKFC